MKRLQENARERGAIVIEASIALTAYIFAIFTLLSVVDICYIQAKMSVALDESAKEISQYSYLYYKFAVDDVQSDLHEGTEDSRQLAKDTADGVNSFLTNVDGAAGSFDYDTGAVDFEGLYDGVSGAAADVDSLVTQYGDAIGDDPWAFVLGMGKMAGDELSGEANAMLAKVMAKSFMKKNLKAYEGDDPDQFLRRYHVVDGLQGLDFDYSTMMSYGSTNEIQLVCTYEVQVIRLLNLDVKVKFRQCAKTLAWGNGVSEMAVPAASEATEEGSVWTDHTPVDRGNIIEDRVREEYSYSSRYHNDSYDFYEPGSNRFVEIVSVHTGMTTYSTADGIRYKLNRELTQMDRQVKGFGDEITLKDSSGNETTVHSDPGTRTYKMILVVPDDADMSVVDQAVTDFKAKQQAAGYTVDVEVMQGFGNSQKAVDAEG